TASSYLFPVLILSISLFIHLTTSPQSYPLSLHDALPISGPAAAHVSRACCPHAVSRRAHRIAADRLLCDGGGHANAVAKSHKERSEEHTSELQSPYDLVCRLLLEKKKKSVIYTRHSSDDT